MAQRKVKSKSKEKASYGALLRNSMVGIGLIVCFLLGGQAVNWVNQRVIEGGRERVEQARSEAQIAFHTTQVIGQILRPSTLENRIGQQSQLEKDLSQLHNSDFKAGREFSDKISTEATRLRKLPEYRAGNAVQPRDSTSIIQACLQLNYAYYQQFATLSQVQSDREARGTQLYLLVLMASAVGTVMVIILFMRPLMGRLVRLYDDFQGAIARIEVQRAELQTQNIKLREQTSAAEDQKREMEELSRLYKDNANQFQSLFAGLPVACYAARPNGEVYEWNSACARLFGIDEADVLQHPVWEVVVKGHDATFLKTQFERALTGRPSNALEGQITRLDGQKIWVFVQSIPMLDAIGRVTGVLTASIDLTERKEAELALQESRNLISRMMESSPQVAYVLNLRDKSVSYANGQFSRLVGMGTEDLEQRGISLRDLVHPEDQSAAMLHWEQIQKGERGQIHEIELRLATVNGEFRWIRTREVVFSTDPNGLVQEIVGSAEDVTKRKADEERLKLLSVVAEKSSSGIVIAGPDQHIVYANPSFATMTGYESEEISNGKQGILSLIPDTQPQWRVADDAMRRSQAYKGELIVNRADGTNFWSDIAITPVFDPEGSLTHYVAIQDDVTERRVIQNQIEISRERLDFALRSSRSAVFDWDLANKNLFLSKDMNIMLGNPPEDIHDGYDFWIGAVHPEDRNRLLHDIDLHMRGDTNVFRNEHRLRSRNGDYLWFMTTGEVVAWDDGQPTRFIGTVIDISDRKSGEKRLAESEQRWNFALEGSGAGVWDWDLVGNSIFLSRQWKQMLGFADLELDNKFEAWEDRIHPEDKELWLADLQNHLSGQSDVASSVVRMLHKNGSYHWFHDRGKVVNHSPDGRPLRMIGMVTDITEQKVAAQIIAESEARFRSAIEALREGFILQEKDGMIKMANPQAADILGVPQDNLLECDESMFLNGAITEFEDPFLISEWPTKVALKQKRPVQGTIVGLKRLAEDITWIEINAAPIYRPNETEPFAAVAVFNDVTGRRLQEELIVQQMAQLNETQVALEARSAELESANDRLRLLATTDGLTGLINHRHFHELLEEAMKKYLTDGGPLSLVLLDVDNFKKFNDQFGHLAGDDVLRDVARVLRETVGEVGTVGRYGGEEFIVLLPEMDKDDAMALMEQVRQKIAEYPCEHRQITASFGIATLKPELAVRTDFVNASDTAMYRSKESGRNQVTHVDELSTDQAA